MTRNFWKKAMLSFGLPVVCFCLFLAAQQIYPFGQLSNMHSDMDIQYVDFFAYLKDVLAGKASAEYSFSLSLGSSTTALMSYYLSSPFHLLVVFFEKSHLQLFFFLVTALKIGCCGLAFCFMLDQRFSLPTLQTALLSAAYAFTQYVAGQMTNIMWLDGVMMLPIMMAGVYRFIDKDRPLLLYLSVALSIVFNWYTAYINCLFIVLYYLFETACRPFAFGRECKKWFHFLFIEALGVLLSCGIFIPVILNQMQGRSVDLNLSAILKLNGEWWEWALAFMLGSSFPSRQITFFCSVFALLLFFSFFFSRRIGRKEKAFTILFVAILYLSFWLMPLEFVWNGFLKANSYSYRHMYIATAGILFIAARYVQTQEKQMHSFSVCLPAAAVLAVLTLLTVYMRKMDPTLLFIQLALIAAYLFATFRTRQCKQKHSAFLLLTIVLFCTELTINAVYASGPLYQHSAQEFTDYSQQQQALITDVQEHDPSVYRMEQTLNRDQSENHHSFYANESLAYGYRGLQSYTSCYESTTADVLIRMGYNTSYFPSFYHDPLLACDSFLGVKYLLSEQHYIGYQALNLESRNGKTVYLNPYALPIGFASEFTDASAITSAPFSSNENPFEYVNELYSAVLGRPVQIYRPVACTQTEIANGRCCTVSGQAELPDTAPAYASFIGFNMHASLLTVNGITQPYNQETWAEADHVVYLGNAADLKEIFLDNGDCIDILLYYLDLDVLAASAEEIRSKQAQITLMEKNRVEASYHAVSDETIMFTIPYREGWKLQVNGKKCAVQQALQNFIAVEVSEGENQIVLEYASPGRIAGMILSAVSIVGYLLLRFLSRHRKTKRADT